MLITFSGNNGSGKTKLSLYLCNYLRNEEREVIYIKEFQYLFINRIKKIFGKKAAEIQSEVMKEREKNIFAYLLPYVVWLDYFIYFNYLRLRKKSYFIIVDRYSLDYVNSWIELGVNNSLIRFIYNFLPKGDIQFYIDVDPQTAFDRFQERAKKNFTVAKIANHNLNLNFYKRNRKIYLEMVNKGKYIVIDGNKSLADCKRQLVSYINANL